MQNFMKHKYSITNNMFLHLFDSHIHPNIPAEYDIVYSHRKTLAIQITPTGQVTIRAPSRCHPLQIERFVQEKMSWIRKHQDRIAEQAPLPHFSPVEIATMKQSLQHYLLPRVEAIWKTTSFPPYKSIKITKSETRWGSCSRENRLNFSYRLATFLDGREHFIDSVIAHELCHLVEKNHKKSFWNLVYTLMPDYQRHP